MGLPGPVPYGKVRLEAPLSIMTVGLWGEEYRDSRPAVGYGVAIDGWLRDALDITAHDWHSQSGMLSEKAHSSRLPAFPDIFVLVFYFAISFPVFYFVLACVALLGRACSRRIARCLACRDS